MVDRDNLQHTGAPGPAAEQSLPYDIRCRIIKGELLIFSGTQFSACGTSLIDSIPRCCGIICSKNEIGSQFIFNHLQIRTIGSKEYGKTLTYHVS